MIFCPAEHLDILEFSGGKIRAYLAPNHSGMSRAESIRISDGENKLRGGGLASVIIIINLTLDNPILITASLFPIRTEFFLGLPHDSHHSIVDDVFNFPEGGEYGKTQSTFVRTTGSGNDAFGLRWECRTCRASCTSRASCHPGPRRRGCPTKRWIHDRGL